MNERSLANENFPAVAVKNLRAQGADVVHASETLVGAPDPVILKNAVDEDRVLLTFDHDFGELVFHQRLPPAPGIVLFRLHPLPPAEVITCLETFFAAATTLRGFFTVVSPASYARLRSQ